MHCFQGGAMQCRPAARLARALKPCCWSELGLQLVVRRFLFSCMDSCDLSTALAQSIRLISKKSRLGAAAASHGTQCTSYIRADS